MILSHSVMHAAFDAKRRAMLDKFLEKLGEETTVIRDENRDGLWVTARRAWAAYNPNADWHIVFQDDMHPCADALDTIREVLASRRCGGEIVSFFQPAIGPARICLEYIEPWRRGIHITALPPNAIAWGGSIAIPTDRIPDFLSWTDRFMPQSRFNVADDEKICFWAWMRQIKILCYAPSLFEHVGYTASVTEGQTHQDWHRGMLIRDEVIGSENDPKWDALRSAIEFH